jgi:hypothetical protein
LKFIVSTAIKKRVPACPRGREEEKVLHALFSRPSGGVKTHGGLTIKLLMQKSDAKFFESFFKFNGKSLKL